MTAALDGERWQRAQQIFDRIVDLPPEQRSAELASACDDDHQLLHMVAGLIAAAARAVPEPTAAIATPNRLADPELAPGTRVGAFRIDRVLGSGGMGRVYLGSRADGRVEQLVAIKTIRGALGGRELLRRFQRERRILAKLNHPNVAHFVDAGECADGAPFFAMEYIAGTPMLEYAQAQRLDLATRLKLLIKIAGAVDYAHRQLVVHRDLKPGNVIVGADGEPKLLDFGIAKSIQQQHQAALIDGHTAPGSRYFSLRYAAPEQLAGETEVVSIDIYALGALLYEFLTGRPPLELAGLPLAAAQARIAHEMPRAPSDNASADLPYPGAQLRGDLDRIVLHALKKEPEQRYASAAALVDDLTRVLEHRPISLRSSHRWYLASRFVRRHRLAVGMATAMLIGSVSAAVVFREQRNIAVQERTRAEVVNAIMIEAFEGADPSRNKGERLSARDVLRQARHAVTTRTDLEGGALTALLLSLSEIHNTLGLFADARALAQQALASAQTDAERLSAEFRLAAALYSDGEGAAAKALLTRMRADPRVAADPRWRIELDLLALDADGFLGTVDVLPQAASIYADASAALGSDDVLTEVAATRYASLLVQRDTELQKGTQLVRSLLARTAADAQTPQRLELLKIAARSERQLGNSAEFLSLAQRHLQLAERLYGVEHGVYVGAESLHAQALDLTGRHADARAQYNSAVERARRVYGPDSGLLALMANNAGDSALHEPMDLQQALAMTAIAVDVGPRAMPPESRVMAFLWLTRATALLYANEADAALAAALSASTIFTHSIEQSGSKHAEAELLAAIAESLLGRTAAASARLAALGDAIDSIKPTSLALQLARTHLPVPGVKP